MRSFSSLHVRLQAAMFLCVLQAAALLVGRSASAADSAEWKVGLARVDITPERPLVLMGYPDRAGPFKSVEAKIYSKAIALEDVKGNRALLVTNDLVGVQNAFIGPVCERITAKTRLPRERMVFNASHTHTGPLVSLNPNTDYNVSTPAMTVEDTKVTAAYSRALQDKLFQVAVSALEDLQPATLSWAKGEVAFVVSRRFPTPKGVVMQANPKGLADRTVPVLKIAGADGKVRGVLFGCACHNVAVGGANAVCGDYAGFAQTFIEDRYPGAQAMFVAGCGADANPSPWGSIDIGKQHGRVLGNEVCRLLESKLDAVGGPLNTAWTQVDLPLQKLSRGEIQAYLPLPNFQARTAAQMLAVLDSGQTLPEQFKVPIAVWQFGNDLTLVVLPGEPVAEYVTLLEKALGPQKLWIAGFSNECFGYLPTAKVIKEGGHEAIGITLWSLGKHLLRNVGFFAPQTETVVVEAVRALAVKAGRDIQLSKSR